MQTHLEANGIMQYNMYHLTAASEVMENLLQPLWLHLLSVNRWTQQNSFSEVQMHIIKQDITITSS